MKSFFAAFVGTLAAVLVIVLITGGYAACVAGAIPEAEYVGENGLHFVIHQHLSGEDLEFVSERLHDYLIERYGINPRGLEVIGKGEAQPADPSDPEAARNRRVVVENIGK